jgi:predicted alpha-1,2-mannosidase
VKNFLIYFLNLCSLIASSQNNSSFVNPFIGTGGHGHTFPGAVMPFGMVQLSPDTRIDGSWDGCSGYHYSDTIIYGFSHTHLSGTGVSDWGDILLMPQSSKVQAVSSGYASGFSHKNENSSPGFYSVRLNNGILAELTTTPRVGIHRYSMTGTDTLNVILDLLHRDKTLSCDLRVQDYQTITGYRISEGWAKKQPVYFVIKFSRPLLSYELASGKIFMPNLNPGDRTEGACFRFSNSKEPLIVKVGISFTGIEGALKNLEAEANHWDFEKYKDDARQAWDKQLQKIELGDSPPEKKRIFYTALYHCFIHPSLNMDVDNKYLGHDGQVHTADNFVNYSVFSLWDTYRSLNPFFTLFERKRTKDFLSSFLAQYRQTGRLPVWTLSSNETDCMIGFHSVSVIADAIEKGIEGIDVPALYEAAKAASTYSGYGIPVFNKKGYLEADNESESVSKTLEYAYDNWCVSRIASKLGLKDEEKVYSKRSKGYVNLFDPSSGFMRPRKNGNWIRNFNATEINNHFTEGNSWQYSFYVPHDIETLKRLHGGAGKFEKKLDELFSAPEVTSGRQQADVTGLIGQYAHGNEPSHHIAYLYNFTGKPAKTTGMVDKICFDFYKDSPDGLIGNEDCGQMSAWYVFSSLGFYPVCPGSGEYITGQPQFPDIKCNFEDGKSLRISADRKGELSGISVNGKISLMSSLNHTTLVSGGNIEFIYGPGQGYGIGKNIPSTIVRVPEIIPAPLINSSSQVFKKNLQVTIQPLIGGGQKIFYSLSNKNADYIKYTIPVVIDSSCVITAFVVKNKDTSAYSSGKFYRLKNNYSIKILSKADPQYAAEGAQSLADGKKGDADWRKGDWLGYQDQNFICEVDMGAITDVHSVSLNCLQDTRSWIIFPSEVKYFLSADGISYYPVGSVKSPIEASDYNISVSPFELKLEAMAKARYLKVIAINFGKLPDWHMGKGGAAYIFTDELDIK